MVRRLLDNTRRLLGRAWLPAGLALLTQVAVAADPPWAGLGRDATPAEIAAWDIDVRPDFKGLPAGSGSVDLGTEIWEARCASCHGVFGESNQVFTPIVGGTTAEDIKTGRVANLLPGKNYPQRTTLMKVATVSSLWDYINRAMPWNAPKSLKPDEVYAVLAYILNLADIVPADFELSDKNIAEVQQRMPNRNGMQVFEPMWRVDGAGDVRNAACMKNCPVDERVTSFLPDFARDAHGNIQAQNRVVGPVRGADTTQPAPATLAQARQVALAAPPPGRSASDEAARAVRELLEASSCTACHGMGEKIVGPGFSQVAERYRNQVGAVDFLAGKIRSGGSGSWGDVPMPPQRQLSEADARRVATWLQAGAP